MAASLVVVERDRLRCANTVPLSLLLLKLKLKLMLLNRPFAAMFLANAEDDFIEIIFLTQFVD